MQVFIIFIVAMYISFNWIEPEGFFGFLGAAFLAIPLTYVLIVLLGFVLTFIAQVYLTICRNRYNKKNPE